MFDRLFSRLSALAWRRKNLVLVTVLLFTALAGAGLLRTSFEGSIDRMLPPDPEIARSMDFLRGSSFSDKVIISIRLTDESRSKKELFSAVDQLAASLAPPLVTKVVSGFSVANVMDEFSFLRYAPQVLGPNDLAAIDRLIEPRAVAARMRGVYLQSMRPESVFTSSLSRSDPLGMQALLMDKMRALPASMGYDVNIEDGHFVSRDGRNAMLIVHTSVAMMDSPRCNQLITELRRRIGELPPYVTADIVSGHQHTVSNEQVVKRDISIVSAIASATFLILFLLVFRDPRVLFVFIIPFIAILWSIMIATGIEGKLLYLVIGLGTAIAGFSVDYGLHVFIALKRGIDGGQFAKLSRLVTINGSTTMFNFLVLYYSRIHGYHQLALFSSLCVFFCLLLALLALPLALSRMKPVPPAGGTSVDERLLRFRWPVKTCLSVWGALTLVALYSALSVTFDSDVKKLDGSSAEVMAAEQRFEQVWGGKGSRAIFVVTGKTLAEAMELNDRVYAEARALGEQGKFASLAQFWPSDRARRENVERWDRFWKAGREATLRALIREHATPYGFSAAAFDPFFQGLYRHEAEGAASGGLIAQLRERFVLCKGGEYRILSYFPDERESVTVCRKMAARYPGAFIVSGRTMSDAISTFTAAEIKVLIPLALFFNALLAWWLFRNVRYTLISLVPLCTGIIWFVGIMSFLKIPLNVINIVASIVSTGVIVDYGLGITYQFRHNLRTGTIVAVSISAATNIIGTGALLFARHPALYSTGVAMFICIIAGYLSAILVVLPLCGLLAPVEASRD